MVVLYNVRLPTFSYGRWAYISNCEACNSRGSSLCHACHFVQASKVWSTTSVLVSLYNTSLAAAQEEMVVQYGTGGGGKYHYLLRMSSCRSRLDSKSLERITTSILLLGHSMCPFIPRMMCVLFALSGDCCCTL